MKKDKFYEEALNFEHEKFKKEMGIVDEGNIVDDDDLIFDDQEEK